MSDGAQVLRLHGDALPWTPQAEAEEPSSAQPTDERFWSVTTIAKAIGSSEGLVAWSAQRAAACAIDDRPVWEAMVERGQRADAISYIAGARYRPRPGNTLQDNEVGTTFHDLAERWVYDGVRPPCDVPEVVPLLDSFDAWLQVAQPTFEALEMTVYNPSLRYAGTLDAIVVVGGVRYVLDYKTSLDPDGKYRKSPWKDVALQLSAYRHAEFVATWRSRRYEVRSRRYYLLSPGERAMAVPMPAVDSGCVLHVTPWHADFYPVETGDDVFEHGFLAALDAASWDYRESDGVIREDMAVFMNTGR